MDLQRKQVNENWKILQDVSSRLSGLKDLPGFSSDVARQVAESLKDSPSFMEHLRSFPVGSILAYSGQSLHAENWAVCDGRRLEKAQFPELYAALGEGAIYGESEAYFYLPNLQGQFLRGLDPTAKVDVEVAQRKNATGQTVGARVGSLQDGELQSHVHEVVLGGGAHSHTVAFTAAVEGEGGDKDSDPHGAHGRSFTIETARDGGTHEHRGTSKPSGGSETRPNNVAVLWIIRIK